MAAYGAEVGAKVLPDAPALVYAVSNGRAAIMPPCEIGKPDWLKMLESTGRIPVAREGAAIGPLEYAAETLGAGAANRCGSGPTVVVGSAVAYMWLWLVGGADTQGFVN